MNVIREDYEVLFTKDFRSNLSKNENKIVLYNARSIKIIPHDKIEKIVKSGIVVNESLTDVIGIIRNINLNELTNSEKITLFENYKLLNKKIVNHNNDLSDTQKKIKLLNEERLFFCKKIIRDGWVEDALFSHIEQDPNFFSNKDQAAQFVAYLKNSHLSLQALLKFPNIWVNLPLSLKNNVTIQILFSSFSLKTRLEAIHKLSLEDRTAYLLTADQSVLRKYFEENSYLEISGLDKLDPLKCLDVITENQKKLLIKITLLEDNQKALEKQNSALFRFLIIEDLQEVVKELLKHPDIIDLQEKNRAHKAIVTAENCQLYISNEKLLKVLKFIRNNKDLIKTSGKESLSRPHVKKIKKIDFNIPYDIRYDSKKDASYIKLKLLGIGTFKAVKAHLKLTSGLPMKAVSKQIFKKEALHELAMLISAKGLPHVISFDGAEIYYSKKRKKFIQEMTFPLYNRGELAHYLYSKEIQYKEKLRLMIEIITGLIGLHERLIIHRDVKPENIFLDVEIENEREVIHAYVADLGLSCLNVDDPLKRHFCGSLLYIPPSILEQREYANYHMDAWALGIVISEFFLGKSPVTDIEKEYILIKVIKELGDLSFNPEPLDKVSVQYIVWKLMQPDPLKRMKLDEALQIFQTLLEKD